MNICPFCAEEIQEAAIVCKHCGREFRPIIRQPQKNPGVAAVLSFFFSGLGQIYNGQIGKGVLFLFMYFISILLIFLAIGIVTTPLLWIFGIVDAYQEATAINEGKIEREPPTTYVPAREITPGSSRPLKLAILFLILFAAVFLVLYGVRDQPSSAPAAKSSDQPQSGRSLRTDNSKPNSKQRPILSASDLTARCAKRTGMSVSAGAADDGRTLNFRDIKIDSSFTSQFIANGGRSCGNDVSLEVLRTAGFEKVAFFNGSNRWTYDLKQRRWQR